jgi:hypothetical protein
MWKRLDVKYPLFVSDVNETWIFATDFLKKKTQISNLIKIRQVGAELFYADGHTDGRMDMTKLIIVFSNFANAPK